MSDSGGDGTKEEEMMTEENEVGRLKWKDVLVCPQVIFFDGVDS